LCNVSLSFLDKKLFHNLNWTIHPKSRVGLVGENGAGKTTLLRMILGWVHPDAGAVEIAGKKQTSIGYLPQELAELEPLPLMVYLKKKSGIAAMEQSLLNLERQLSHVKSHTAQYSTISQTYSDALSRFSAVDGYAFEARAKQFLKGFSFREDDFAQPCDAFSGGWKMRILLAATLLAKPEIMLLDEPTNHLDTESMEWLESYLKDYPGTLIVVSHDRFFLDKTVTQIAELSSGSIHLYKGNHSFYLAEKERRLADLKKTMELQKAQIKKIEAFVGRFRYKATKAAQVQSRIKMLEKFAEVRMEGKTKSVVMHFPEGKQSAREVVKVADVAHRYGNRMIFENINFTLFRSEKVAFVGVNGSGKSTLSRLLSLSEQPSHGLIRYGEGVNMAFFSQESAQNLNDAHTLWQEINSLPTRASDQVKRNLLGAFLFSGDDIFKPVAVLSGGEKSRLALLKIMLLDTNFLILDEPTNHLDVKTKEVFQNALIHYHGTVAIVSHDRYFLDRLVNRVFELRDGTLHVYDGNYSYFIEKRGQKILPVQESVEKKEKKVPQGGFRTKEQKRMEAEARNKLSGMKNTCRKTLTDLERKIEMLEIQKAQHEKTLCLPETHKDAQKVKTISLELKAINKELDKSYDLWTEFHAKLEQISSDSN
jgi:ATP-binding cassette subfamily F protein 3